MPRFGVPTQPLQIPFAEGLNTKPHPFALQPPDLAVCRDAQFDQFGVLQTRKPYASIGNNILSGGTLANIRKLAANSSELLAFTDTGLYSRDARDSAWVLKGTHLAAKVDQTPTPGTATSDDQVNVDRAELGGVVFYAWDAANSTAQYVAAVDKTTGAVIQPPTAIAHNSWRPKLVALGTKVLYFRQDLVTLDFVVSALDPASVATSIANAVSSQVIVEAAATFANWFDAERYPGNDTGIVAWQNSALQYGIATVTSGLSVSKVSKARTTGTIAIACVPDGSAVQVIRSNGANVQGDRLSLPAFTDQATNQAIGTGTSSTMHIAAAFSSTLNAGAYTCHAFWSFNEATDSAGSPGGTKHNTVDTGGALGTQAQFMQNLAVASRAFDVGGRVFVNLVFNMTAATTVSAGATTNIVGVLQNTYFLYRDDGFLVGKAVQAVAGGYVGSNILPGVTLTSTGAYAWMGTYRRSLQLGGNLDGYSPRHPVEISITFDTNAARRSVRLGRTLYVAAGSEILQYDGSQLVEVGFHVYPWRLDLTDFAAGNLAAGVYAYKQLWRWENAQGERERSTTATAGQITMGASRECSVIGWHQPNATHKKGTSVPVAELWRTAANPTLTAPFYLATSSDPSATANPNRYVAADPTAIGLPTVLDSYADATLTGKETDPETGGVLPNIAPPPASIIASNADRVFLAGIAGDPDRVWYSKSRANGEIAAFNDALLMNIPPTGGDIVALVFLNETLIVFRQKAIYALPGDGFANDGSGSNFGPARVISYDIGAVDADAVATTPVGLIFKSAKGWYQLDRGWSLQYIGGQTASFDGDTVLSVDVVESQHQIRVMTNARVLVYDWLVKQWAEWTIANGVDAVVWQGTYVYATATNVFQEQATYSGVTYGIDVETGWIKLNDLQGFGRLRGINVLGEYRSAHTVQIRVARDYQSDGAGSWVWFDNVTWTPSPTTVGGAEQVRHPPSVQQLQAVKVRITVNPTGGADSVTLAGLGMDVAIRPEVMRRLPSTQKV